MQVMAFFPCERVVNRWNGSKDIMNYGLRKVYIKAKEEGEEASGKIGIVCRLSYTAAEKGKKGLDLHLISMDGKVMEKVNFEFEVPESTGEIDIIGTMPIKANESGKYVIIATQDGFEIARWPLGIQVIKQQSGPSSDQNQDQQ